MTYEGEDKQDYQSNNGDSQTQPTYHRSSFRREKKDPWKWPIIIGIMAVLFSPIVYFGLKDYNQDKAQKTEQVQTGELEQATVDSLQQLKTIDSTTVEKH